MQTFRDKEALVAEPSALRWLVGNELREHRERAGRKGTEAAKILKCTSPKISQLEAGLYRQRPDEVAKLMEFYGASTSDVDRLVRLASQEDATTWWGAWTDVVPDWLQTFVGLERLAASAFTYQPLVVPALFQTEDYAAALTSASPRVRPDHGDRVVAFRMERQTRLFTDIEPLQIHAVIEETALHRPTGGRDVQRGQLKHLLDLTNLPNVDIQVMPTSVGAHAGHTGQFVLLSFENYRDVAYVELQEGAVYALEPAQIRAYKMSAKSLGDAALGQRQSISLITSLLKEM